MKAVVLARWPGLVGYVLIDGHARVRAAFAAGITRVPFVLMLFPDEISALQHAMSLQAKRRTTTDGALYRLSQQYDRLMERGGDRRSVKDLSCSICVLTINCLLGPPWNEDHVILAVPDRLI